MISDLRENVSVIKLLSNSGRRVGVSVIKEVANFEQQICYVIMYIHAFPSNLTPIPTFRNPKAKPLFPCLRFVERTFTYSYCLFRRKGFLFFATLHCDDNHHDHHLPLTLSSEYSN